MPGFRKYAATVAVFATGLFLALTIAVFGVISLLADVEVIADPHAGELVGPVAIAAATALMIGCLLAIALRVPEERQRVAPLTALAIAVGAYLAYGFVAAIAYLFSGADGVAALIFLGAQLTGPFGIAVAAIAFVITMLFMLVLASRIAERGRPRWPWENHDDE